MKFAELTLPDGEQCFCSQDGACWILPASEKTGAAPQAQSLVKTMAGDTYVMQAPSLVRSLLTSDS